MFLEPSQKDEIEAENEQEALTKYVNLLTIITPIYIKVAAVNSNFTPPCSIGQNDSLGRDDSDNYLPPAVHSGS